MRLRVIIAFGLLLLSGCNSLFYHPDRVEYKHPSDLGINHTSKFVKADPNHLLHVWILSPSASSPRGSILHFHGNAQNMSAHFLFVAWLAQEGYEVVTFDYRGYGKSNGTPSRSGLDRDGKTILNFWFQYSQKQKNRYIVAQSLGTAIAIHALANSTQRAYNAIVLESPFSSYRSLAQEKLAQFWLTWPLQWPLSFLVSNESSAEDAINRLNAPILFIHGTNDGVIPIDEAEKLFRKLYSENKTFWKIENSGHTPVLGNAESPYRKKLLNFLCQHSTNSAECHGNSN